MAKWLCEFQAGALAPGKRIAHAIEQAAWRLDCTARISSSGWLVREFAIQIEGSEHALRELKRYAARLLAANDFG